MKPEIMITEFAGEEFLKTLEMLEIVADQFGPQQPLLLNINSHGGSVAGMAQLYEKIQLLENPIVTYTSSVAMSAGAILLSIAGDPKCRFASPNSSIMLHELQLSGGGGQQDIKDFNSFNSFINYENQKWMDILAKSMGLGNWKKLREMFVARGAHELYLSAEEAMKLNIIDGVCYVKTVEETRHMIIKDTRSRKQLRDELEGVECCDKHKKVKKGKK